MAHDPRILWFRGQEQYCSITRLKASTSPHGSNQVIPHYSTQMPVYRLFVLGWLEEMQTGEEGQSTLQLSEQTDTLEVFVGITLRCTPSCGLLRCTRKPSHHSCLASARANRW